MLRALERPDRVAAVMASGRASVSYRELDERSRRLARLLWEAGLRRGDAVAVLMENHLRFFDVYWAALRSGLYLVPVNHHLTAGEGAYIVNDSGARALVSSKALAVLATDVVDRSPLVAVRLMVDGSVPGFDDYESALAATSSRPLADEPLGDTMSYSSGTTGRPKGIMRPLPDRPATDRSTGLRRLIGPLFPLDTDTTYLSPAPLYHAAPLGFTTTVQATGGTTVIMERFDPVAALQAIETFAITASQWVPTMFVRMLKLPDVDRRRFDLSSHRAAVHAAAPCPPDVKRQMMAWWGPILIEYYAGSERSGFTVCHADEWLAHPGTVGRAILGTIRVCDDDGGEVAAGQTGTIFFERTSVPFVYHNDPAMTRAAQHPAHPNWSTLGDVGHLDDDGFLYLTDRRSFTIIAGGVNIYPREIEDAMILHPAVEDVAVVGVPNADLGEEVKAVVQLQANVAADDATRGELLEWTAQRVARFKVPRSIDFTEQLPRSPTGKLLKRLVRQPYWEPPTDAGPDLRGVGGR